MLLNKISLTLRAGTTGQKRLTGLMLVSAILSACSATGPTSLYEEIGGQKTITQLADQFVMEIAYDPRVLPRFADSNVERFREKIIEHFCWIADGPCEYTGDSMINVHAGMNINSAEFNAVVEDLIAAMDKTGIALSAQNQLLERLAALRPEIMGI